MSSRSRRIIRNCVVVLAIFGGIPYLGSMFFESEIKSFCSSIKDDDDLDAVVKAAKDKQFVLLDRRQDGGTVSILNHRTPAFRFECRVHQTTSGPLSAKLISAD